MLKLAMTVAMIASAKGKVWDYSTDSKTIDAHKLKIHHLVFFEPGAAYEPGIRAAMGEAAGDPALENHLLHILVPASQAGGIMRYFAFSQANILASEPASIIVDMSHNDEKAYFSTENHVEGKSPLLTADGLRTFESAFLGGTALRHVKSEPPRDANARYENHVRVIVGSEVEPVLMADEHDVLIFIYKPSCPHCVKLKPKYDEIALMHKDTPGLVIAKMDGTKNTFAHPEVHLTGYPYIVFFNGASKRERMVNAGGVLVSDNMLTDFQAFLLKHAHNKPADLEEL